MTRFGRRRGLVARVAVGAVLIATVVSLIVIGGNSGDEDGSMDVAAQIERVIREHEGFVESARGLRFLRPAKVTVLTEEQFQARLVRDDARDTPDRMAETAVLGALGLVDPRVEAAQRDDPNAEGVAGFYDAKADELVVRLQAPTPFVRQVLVHELTHALDDQHFRLDRSHPDADGELAFSALVEGSALVVEKLYLDSLPAAEQEAARREEATHFERAAMDVPMALAELADFPYVHGPSFVRALVAAGGRAGLDAAFASPPRTSSSVLHPELYLAGHGSRPLPAPPADSTVVDDGHLGEHLLALMLADVLDRRQAEEAARGWAGDAYVLWREAGRNCIRAAIRTQTTVDAAELADAVRIWTVRKGGATVDEVDPVRFTRCA